MPCLPGASQAGVRHVDNHVAEQVHTYATFNETQKRSFDLQLAAGE